MEINSSLITGFIFGTYMFLFCTVSYYINNVFFKKDINGINMFFYIGKPLYRYKLKNGIKINFGYIPIGSFISFKEKDDSVSENDEGIRYNHRRTKILNLIILAVTIFFLFAITYIFGYNPIKIFKDILSIEYQLITKELNYESFSPMIKDRYLWYGRSFFLFFFVFSQMIISAILIFVFSLWEYLGLICMIILIIAYFRYDLSFFMFPLHFYFDIFLSFLVSGFLYFLLLRFFIK